jgi:hypothetical protein
MISRGSRVAVVAVLICAVAAPAVADDTIPGHRIDRPTTGVVALGALGVGIVASLIPMREDRGLWRHELFGAADDRVHDNFSLRASQISDVLLGASLAAPIAYLIGTRIDDADGDRLLIYGEAVAFDFALFQIVKRVVQRPRPYRYSSSPDAVAYAQSQGDDADLSFYSGHAATSFCAATAGAYLLSASSASRGERAFAWAGGFAAAAATSNLRVRAGKHFYSDVTIGAAVGVAIGYLVPALHADAGAYVPDTLDLVAAAAGLLGGVAISQLLPLGARDGGRDTAQLGQPGHVELHLGPVPISSGAMVSIAGTL